MLYVLFFASVVLTVVLGDDLIPLPTSLQHTFEKMNEVKNRRGYDNSDTLVATWIYSYSWGDERKMEVESIKCSIRLFHNNIGGHTPARAYVFYRIAPPDSVKEEIKKYSKRTHFIKLSDEDWKIPENAEKKRDRWTTTGFGDDYRLMGHWRLTHFLTFFYKLGFKYVLFLDDDSYVWGPIEEHLVKGFKEKQISVAYKNVAHDEEPARGLAELARYFIVSNSYTPTQLYKDCKPDNIMGVYTGKLDKDGWQYSVMYGNFVIIGLDFYFQPLVQEFLKLVINTGDQIVHRWNEQLVFGMIRLMFAKPENDLKMQFKFEHGDRDRHNARFCPK